MAPMAVSLFSERMHVAAEDLRLDRLCVVHPGAQSFDLAPDIRAIAFTRLLDDLSVERRLAVPAPR